jgi:hypothetical protein
MDATIRCPHCGGVNSNALKNGATDGPRQYHAECWLAMDDAEQTAAWADHAIVSLHDRIENLNP